MNKYDKEYFKGTYPSLVIEKKAIAKIFFDELQKHKPDFLNLLDIGCGQGEFLEYSQSKGKDCFGIDISDFALKVAQKKVRAKFLNLDLEKEKIPLSQNFFDVVTCFDVVEHLKNPNLLLGEAARVLKRDGLLFLTTPNADYWLGSFLALFIRPDSTDINIQNKFYWERRLLKAKFKNIKTKGCVAFGLPPTHNLRVWLLRHDLPALVKPIFSTINFLSSELFFFANKSAGR